LAAVLTFTCASTVAGEAAAQQRPSTETGAAQRFQTPDGGVRFVLDRTGQRAALIRFEGSDEVHVLRPIGGPRGDEIYKTDTGDVMLRITPMGGVIVYREDSPNGAPAIMTGQVARLAPAPPSNLSLRTHLAELERAAQNRFGRAVPVELAAAPPPAASAVVADAARRAAEGLQSAPPSAMRVERVVIQMGDRPGVIVVNRQLMITVAPNQGYEGRPSAAAVSRAIQPQVDIAGGPGR
jgi:hypothetical protein